MPEFSRSNTYTTLFIQAVTQALDMHRKQIEGEKDKTPFSSRILKIAALVLEMGGTENQAIAGLLQYTTASLKIPSSVLGNTFGREIDEILKLIGRTHFHPDNQDISGAIANPRARKLGIPLIVLATLIWESDRDLKKYYQSLLDSERYVVPYYLLNRQLELLSALFCLPEGELPPIYLNQAREQVLKTVASNPYSFYVTRSGLVFYKGEISAWQYHLSDPPQVARLEDLENIKSENWHWHAQSIVEILDSICCADGERSPAELFPPERLDLFSQAKP